MHRKGHLGVTLLTWAPAVAVVAARFDHLLLYALAGTMILVNPLMPLAVAASGRLGVLWGRYSLSLCMIPDLDMKIPGVSHRGITHTVWFALAFGALSAGIGYGVIILASTVVERPDDAELYGAVAFSGYLGFHAIASHILADALTPMGIRPFAPLSKRSYGIGVVRADNTVANVGLLLVGVAAVVLAFAVPQGGLEAAGLQ